MATMTATDAKNKFGELVETARAEPVHIQRNGRDVVVLLSAEEFQRLSELDKRGPNARVMEAHARSIKRFSKVYEALAK